MYTRRLQQRSTAVLGALIILSLVIIPTNATHSITGPNYGPSAALLQMGANARTGTSGPLTLTVRDYTVATSYGAWSEEVKEAVTDWSKPAEKQPKQTYPATDLRMQERPAYRPPRRKGPVLLTYEPGSGRSDLKQCRPTAGLIVVCNYAYGKKGCPAWPRFGPAGVISPRPQRSSMTPTSLMPTT